MSILERQSFLEVKSGRGSPICKKTASANYGNKISEDKIMKTFSIPSCIIYIIIKDFDNLDKK